MSDTPEKEKPFGLQVPDRHSVWHHRRGYFEVIVDDSFTARGTVWVKYFIVENCDETHAKHEGAYAEQRLDDPMDLAREGFFEKNQLHVASIDRFHRKFASDPPENPVKIPVRKPPSKLMIIQVQKPKTQQ